MAVTKSMTAAEMRQYVRDALDTDSTDLSDDLVNGWLIEASDQIEAYTDSWAFREATYSLSVLAGIQAYVFSDAGGLTRDAAFGSNLLRIDTVNGPTIQLDPIQHPDARAIYTANYTGQSKPLRYSVSQFTMYLWPNPAVDGTYTVDGYRQAIDWIGTNAAADFPSEFHHVLATWAVSRAYAREGDPGMASFYEAEFGNALQRRATHYIARGLEQPLILNGGVRQARYPRGRFPYSWE